MPSYLEKRLTRFRAYQLGTPGSSFSYFDGTTFTLIEARLTDLSRPRVYEEMQTCGVSNIGCLHITSWDADHSSASELPEILTRLTPRTIECPGYPPETDSAIACQQIISAYHVSMARMQTAVTVRSVDPQYVRSLNPAESFGYRDVVYHPKYLSNNSNDNSTVKLFRTGAFNVASLGDVEDREIGTSLRRCRMFKSEVDVLILAHHGADNGLTTSKFINAIRPTVAICSSNYDNQYDHPRDEVRQILNNADVRLYTTKTGDVVVHSIVPHDSQYQVVNLCSESSEISSTSKHASKKSRMLRMNLDTIRNICQPRQTYPR